MAKIFGTQTDDTPWLVDTRDGADFYAADVELGLTPHESRAAYFDEIATRTCGHGHVRDLAARPLKFEPANCELWDIQGVTCNSRAWTTYRLTFQCPVAR